MGSHNVLRDLRSKMGVAGRMLMLQRQAFVMQTQEEARAAQSTMSKGPFSNTCTYAELAEPTQLRAASRSAATASAGVPAAPAPASASASASASAPPRDAGGRQSRAERS
eukprot:NODE_8293_length_390_cov_151.961194.p3 GENE.NODE_8293_length_390_cov_151.961194~~NODE_8293_length_390_cov_151.961194.p3  ORF type:complete len:110 (+),score=35.83 NODE_8293_length_390_cov_151.961194:3-332(+)